MAKNMRITTIIWIIVAAVVIAGIVVTLYIFGPQLGTQVAPQDDCVVTATDSDGDCVPNHIDYYPNRPER